MIKIRECMVRSLVVAVILAWSTVQGGIVVSNFSFELPHQSGDGDINIGTVDGWMESGGVIGNFNPSTDFYTDPAVTDANGATLGAMNASNALFFANDSNEYVTQTLATSIVPGLTYTLTVAVGDRDAGGRSGFAGYDLRLLADGLAVASISANTSPGDGTFTDVQLVYTAQAGDAGALGIRLGTSDAGAGKSTDFDNIRLVCTTSPPPSSIAINAPVNRQIVQRDFGGKADLTIAGTYTGAGTEIQARAVAIDGNGTDTGWVTIDDAPSGGTFSAALRVQTGWYQLEVRLLNGASEEAVAAIANVGVGDMFIVAGQSNAANFGESVQSSDDGRVSYFNLGNNSWSHADDPPGNPSTFPGTRGAPWPELGDLLTAADDVPVGFVPVADGGSSVSSWVPASNDNYSNLQAAVQSFGPHGFRAVLWHQGERDNVLNTSTASYVSDLETVIASSRSDAGWNVPWFVALVSYGDSPTDTNANIIAAQQQVIHEDANVFLGSSTDDLIGINPATGEDWRFDGIHFSDEGLEEHALRWFTALDSVFNDVEIFLDSDEDSRLNLSITGTLGQSCRVEQSTNLIFHSWYVVSNIASLTSSPKTFSVTVSNAAAYYRVVLNP